MSARVEAIMKLEVPLIVELGRRTLPVKDVVALLPGAIIELPKNAEEELEILVNNKQVGVGRAVKVGENFGVRISFIGDLKKRIEAMGAAEQAKAKENAIDALADQLLAGQG